MIQLNFKRLYDNAILPTREYETDAGIDFYALQNSFLVKGETKIINTGIAWHPEFDQNYFETIHFNIYMKIEDRSGLSSKTGLHVKAGVIDETYRGEIGIVMYNGSSETIEIRAGQKIAQGIVYIIPKTNIKEVKDINKTIRGANGFGSTGN